MAAAKEGAAHLPSPHPRRGPILRSATAAKPAVPPARQALRPERASRDSAVR